MSGKKQLLLVGNWAQDIYEQAMAGGFRATGWDVVPFKTLDYLSQVRLVIQLRRLRSRWTCGRLKRALVNVVKTTRPDMIIFFRCDEILPETLATVRAVSPASFLISYHNDNPFVAGIRRFTMRHYIANLAIVDLALVYRPGDIPAARKCGARRVKVLPPSFISDRHLPIPGGEQNDVVFIGHYAADGREQVLQALHDAGVPVRVYGPHWEASQHRKPWLARQNIRRVWGEEYAALLSGAKIALVFLSARNSDVYTRRCFEIPACGSLMMAPRTPELEKYFEDGREAVFWDSSADLVTKVQYFLKHDAERISIAAAGRARLLRDGHDEYARAQQVILWYEQERANS
jgi:spore maturation protein CgeB